MKTIIPLNYAQALAEELIAMLRPGCGRIEVAGSIRRKVGDVGDIEIVCQTDADGLTLADQLLAQGVLTKRHAWGAAYKAAMWRGINVDIFVVLPDRQWGATFWLRTGSREANQIAVTQRYKNGLLPDDIIFNQGQFWRLDRSLAEIERAHSAVGFEKLKNKGDWSAYNGVILPTPEESDVFAILGIPYVEPVYRLPANYRRHAQRTPAASPSGLRTIDAITVYQPWASLIPLGAKRYETRHWKPSRELIGELIAIHAGRNREELDSIEATMITMRGWDEERKRQYVSSDPRGVYLRHLQTALTGHSRTPSDLPLGVILCICRLVGVHNVETIRGDLDQRERGFGNYADGRYAWELEVVQVFDPPIPQAGQQGIWRWTVPASVEITAEASHA